MATYTISISHIDTCFPGYVIDHHNREGELLIGVPVQRTTLTGEVRSELKGEIDGAWDMPKEITDDMIELALDDELPASTHNTAFDNSLEAGDSDDDECPQAWFVVSWEETDEA